MQYRHVIGSERHRIDIGNGMGSGGEWGVSLSICHGEVWVVTGLAEGTVCVGLVKVREELRTVWAVGKGDSLGEWWLLLGRGDGGELGGGSRKSDGRTWINAQRDKEVSESMWGGCWRWFFGSWLKIGQWSVWWDWCWCYGGEREWVHNEGVCRKKCLAAQGPPAMKAGGSEKRLLDQEL